MHFLSVPVECDDVLVRVKLEAQNAEVLGSVLDGTNLRLGKVSSAFATWSKKTRPEHVRPGRCGIVSELSGNNSLSSFFRFRRMARIHKLARNRKLAHMLSHNHRLAHSHKLVRNHRLVRNRKLVHSNDVVHDAASWLREDHGTMHQSCRIASLGSRCRNIQHHNRKLAHNHRLARNHRLAHNRKQAHSSHYLLGGDCRKDRLLQRYLNTIKVRPIDRLSKTLDSWVRLLDTEIG